MIQKICDIYNVKDLLVTKEYSQAIKIVSQAKNRLKQLPGVNNDIMTNPDTDTDFFMVIFEQLNNFYKHSLEYNLYLTDVVTKLCQIPHESIFQFMVNPDEKSDYSLINCLIKLSSPIKDFENSVQKIKELAQQSDNLPLSEHNTEIELEGLFIEFSKEVVISLYVVDEKLNRLDLSLSSFLLLLV